MVFQHLHSPPSPRLEVIICTSEAWRMQKDLHFAGQTTTECQETSLLVSDTYDCSRYAVLETGTLL